MGDCGDRVRSPGVSGRFWEVGQELRQSLSLMPLRRSIHKASAASTVTTENRRLVGLFGVFHRETIPFLGPCRSKALPSSASARAPKVGDRSRLGFEKAKYATLLCTGLSQGKADSRGWGSAEVCLKPKYYSWVDRNAQLGDGDRWFMSTKVLLGCHVF